MNCLKCGACCRNLIIEAEQLDVMREPRIAAECRKLDGNGTIPEEDVKWCLAPRIVDGKMCGCPFLTPANQCGIYPTRPNVCV